MTRAFHGVILDLDDTLVDTHVLAPLRQQRKWKECVKRLEETRLFPGVTQMLADLGAAGIRMAVVTTSVSHYAKHVLQHHGLWPIALVAYHDAPRPKPAPDSIHKALGLMQLSPQHCLGLGDKLTDLQAYWATGMPAVGAGWSPYLERANWNAIAQAPTQVPGMLGLPARP